MEFGTMNKEGIVETKTIDQSKLTTDCWSVQIQGVAACEKCEFFNTASCGGKAILKRRVEAQEYWEQLGTIPVTGDGELESAFLHFPVGTDSEDIWHWFESTYDLPVVKDLMGLK